MLNKSEIEMNIIPLKHFVLLLSCSRMSGWWTRRFVVVRLLPSVIVLSWCFKRRSFVHLSISMHENSHMLTNASFLFHSSIVYSSTHRLIVLDFFFFLDDKSSLLSSSVHQQRCFKHTSTHTHTFIAWRYITLMFEYRRCRLFLWQASVQCSFSSWVIDYSPVVLLYSIS